MILCWDRILLCNPGWLGNCYLYRLASNSLFSPGWSWTLGNPPVSASWCCNYRHVPLGGVVDVVWKWMLTSSFLMDWMSLRAVLPLRIYLCVCASGLRASLANSTICVYFGKAGSVREWMHCQKFLVQGVGNWWESGTAKSSSLRGKLNCVSHNMPGVCTWVFWCTCLAAHPSLPSHLSNALTGASGEVLCLNCL